MGARPRRDSSSMKATEGTEGRQGRGGPHTRVSSGSRCTYCRDYKHTEPGREKGLERAVPRNKAGFDWLGLVYDS